MFTRKDLIRLIIPLIIEQTLVVFVGMADGMMVARVGEAAVSGVSLVDSINILLIGLFAALATGGAVVSAQYLGHKEGKNACVAGEQLIASTLALSLLLMSLTFLGRDFILGFLFGDVAPDVMENARIYLFYSAMSYPFLAVYNASAALFRSMGNSKVSMKISFVMNLINVSGNALFIFVFDMGVAGAAIATLLSRMFAAITMFVLLKDKTLAIHVERIKDFRIHPAMVKRILRIGIPNGMENSAFQVGKILVHGIIAGLGTSAITANAIAGTVGGLSVLPGSAMSLGLITVVGQCVGACDFDGVKRYTYKLLKVTHLVMGGINVIIFFMIPIILRLYNVTEETYGIASQLITYHCVLSTLLWPISFTLPNALRAANDVKFTMWISMVSMWVWRIGFSYILAIIFDFGVLGVWIAMTIDWLFRSICFITRFHKEKYRSISTI
ncbi:MATE family efflux transporter [Mobilitalea sibirica]|uniref:Probable multidrug resistance protein NorM n=1 Tax=Mobilitalea sibirica TaxID=1462919 RepID=A0A8J7KSF1_9FIRM|nr:MATE family efflux transporter [Mobilitalea sibirica]MBH1940236.1 MATE family efflux transporter [Mobilitalea sibirica]